MKKKGLIAMIAVVALFAAGIALADTGENAAVTVGGTGQITEGPTIPGNVTAQGGNVTRVDLESNASTIKWQGFYGNVSGTILLGLSTNVLYDFGSAQLISVYASQNQSFDWSNLDEATAADVDTAFGFSTATDVDQAADVFTGTLSIDGLVNTPSTPLEDGNFQCYIADDSTVAPSDPSYFAFGGEVQNSGAVGFDGNSWQYELLVPINAGTPTYYFFMSI